MKTADERKLKNERKAAMETERLKAMYVYEQACFEEGMSLVAGMDEVGRGPLAGPVVACALILPKGCLIPGVNDSKKLSPKKRETLSAAIREKALDIGIGVVDWAIIDEINILNATHLAMRQALEGLRTPPDMTLVDGRAVPGLGAPQTPILQGDCKSLSIGAASIVAKVYRDSLMTAYHELYPAYGFDANKGYGTKKHIEAIRRIGLCPIHRRSFVKNFVGSME